MAATAQPQPLVPKQSLLLRLVRGFGWFLLIPLTAVIVLLGLTWWEVTAYQAAHAGKIFTGVSIGQIDVGGLTEEEAFEKVARFRPKTPTQTLVLFDERTDQRWVKNSAELGISYDTDSLVTAAYQLGRTGDEQQQLYDQFDLWYHGATLQPSIVIDEQYVDQWLDEIAALIDQPATDGTLDVAGNEVVYAPGQSGYMLDRNATRAALVAPLFGFESAEIPITITEIEPRTNELDQSATAIQNVIGSPMSLYIEKPMDGIDLQSLELPTEKLVEWMRIEWTDVDGKREPRVFLDEVAAAAWVSQFAEDLYRKPTRARFYFDDLTQELVLVEPHADGRELDVDATVANIAAAVTSPNRSIPLALNEIVPIVSSDATAAELGITELVVDATTSFAGSSPERMANIARSAENFYGLVVAPGENFSFNEYLGEISAEQGYETGLIIFGGQTIEGIGGGVCQVSTTLYQAAFWGGFDLGSRIPHGYRVAYYENALAKDGLSNIGMDATIYSPIVDMTFTNNTDHYLLIENYYRARTQSLTFKIYSTDIGRKVERTLNIWDRTDAKPDLYRYNPNWRGQDFKQVEWAAGGAEVEIQRFVYNADGALHDEDAMRSSYVPWGNVFEFGPNTDRSLIPAGANIQE